MTSGSFLKSLRENAGYTMDEAAMILGVTTVSINNWERGQVMRYPQMLSNLLDVYKASSKERLSMVILMYGDEKDMDYYEKTFGGSKDEQREARFV